MIAPVVFCSIVVNRSSSRLLVYVPGKIVAQKISRAMPAGNSGLAMSTYPWRKHPPRRYFDILLTLLSLHLFLLFIKKTDKRLYNSFEVKTTLFLIITGDL
jgi:hypothetical protein